MFFCNVTRSCSVRDGNLVGAGGRGTHPPPPGFKFPTTHPTTRLGSQFPFIPIIRVGNGYPSGDSSDKEPLSLAWICNGTDGELEPDTPSFAGGGLKLPAPSSDTIKAARGRGRDFGVLPPRLLRDTSEVVSF
jgi:hypothetical protein